MTRLFFLSAEYFIARKNMKTVKAEIRATLDGKYPYVPAVVNCNGRIKPGVAQVGGIEQKVEGSC